MPETHLDRALAEEFSDQAKAIHALKAKDTKFRKLLERNQAASKPASSIV